MVDLLWFGLFICVVWFGWGGLEFELVIGCWVLVLVNWFDFVWLGVWGCLVWLFIVLFIVFHIKYLCYY